MKKLICMLLVLAMVLSLCACGSGNSAQTQETQRTEEQNDTTEKKSPENTSKEIVEDVFGYRYYLPCEDQVDSTLYGIKFDTEYCGESTVFVYKVDKREFTSWDAVITDCKDDVINSIFDARLCRGLSEQTVDNSELMTNGQGEELLRVTGQFQTTDGDVDYIIYYHVTDDNFIRFFVGVMNDDNAARVTEVVDYMAEHLEKA